MYCFMFLLLESKICKGRDLRLLVCCSSPSTICNAYRKYIIIISVEQMNKLIINFVPSHVNFPNL